MAQALPEQHVAHPQDKYSRSTVPGDHIVMLGRSTCPFCVRHLNNLQNALPHINAKRVAHGARQVHFTLIDPTRMGSGVPSTAHFYDNKTVTFARGSQQPPFYNALAARQAELVQKYESKLGHQVSAVSDKLNKFSAAANSAMDTAKRGKGFLDELKSIGSKVKAAVPEIEEGVETAAMLAGGARRRGRRKGRQRSPRKKKKASSAAASGHARRSRVVQTLQQAIYDLGPEKREKWKPSQDVVITEVLASGTPSEENPDIMKEVHVYTLLNNLNTHEHLAVFGEVLNTGKVTTQDIHTLDVATHIPHHSVGMVPSTQIASILQKELGYKVHEEALPSSD